MGNSLRRNLFVQYPILTTGPLSTACVRAPGLLAWWCQFPHNTMSYSAAQLLTTLVIGVLLGVLAVDLAFDRHVLAAIDYDIFSPVSPSRAELPAFAAAAEYYGNTTTTPHMGAVIMGSIGILACCSVLQLVVRRSWQDIVQLVALCCAAPYFVLFMGPASQRASTSEGVQRAEDLVTVLRGHILLTTLCVMAFLLSASAPTAAAKAKQA